MEVNQYLFLESEIPDIQEVILDDSIKYANGLQSSQDFSDDCLASTNFGNYQSMIFFIFTNKF